jgi:endonuclease/exonuclease/phosphatase (EEP) superfamily protein YafD
MLFGNLTAEWTWLSQLTVHFQWQGLVLALTTAGLALCLRSRNWLAVACLGICWHGVLLAPWWWSVSDQVRLQQIDETDSLRVMTYNVHALNHQTAAVIRLLEREQPDILCIQELTTAWDRVLKEQFPYRAAFPSDGFFGGGIYSKYPLQRISEIPLSGDNKGLRAVCLTPTGELELIVIHPVSPVTPADARLRDVQLQRLQTEMGEINGACLVLGDFNSSPWTATMRAFEQQTRFRNARQAAGLHGTWPSWNWFLRVPIDHIYHTPEIVVLRSWISSSGGSDHLPVLVDCVLRQAVTTPTTP